MEYKTPKVLEASPSVAGFGLLFLLTVIVCLVIFVFTVMSNWQVSLIFLVIIGVLFYVRIKFNDLNGFSKFLRFYFGFHCVVQHKNLKRLLTESKAALYAEDSENNK